MQKHKLSQTAEQSDAWPHRPIRAQSFKGSFNSAHALESSYIAEQSVIGEIILDEKSLAKVVDVIKSEYFYFAELKVCYKVILELSRNGCPIDFVTVLN